MIHFAAWFFPNCQCRRLSYSKPGGQLTTRALHILSTTLANRCMNASVQQQLAKALDARARSRQKGRSGEHIERNEVHLSTYPVQQLHQPPGIIVTVIFTV